MLSVKRKYHTPVMLSECLEGLDIREGGLYVDLTFGGGGHSLAILEQLKGGHLYAVDQDSDAEAQAALLTSSQFTFVKTNFRFFARYLKMYGVQKVDGILADLGVSSHQIDDPVRGFSTRFQGKLDMRMDSRQKLTAAKIVNNAEEAELHKYFGMYGEVRNARTLAQNIIRARSQNPLNTIDDFKDVVIRSAPKGREYKYLAQVFQALRIVVNAEMEALSEMLEATASVIRPGGRLVIMSYHSLEDRLVKNYVNKGNIDGTVEKDFYGNNLRPFEPLTRKPVTASEAEIAENPRARSAKLRIARRLDD